MMSWMPFPSLLSLQAIKVLRFKHQQQLRYAKFRYGMMDKIYDQQGKVIPEQAEEELTQTEEVQVEQYRQVFDPENKELDFRRLRPRDVKSNPRVFIPKPRNNKDEEELKVRNHLEEKVMLDYLQEQEDCNNFAPSEKRGIKSLRARIEAEEIVVYPTDKSGRLAVTSRSSYSQQGAKHVAGDRVVDWVEVEAAQITVKHHLWALNRVFNPGQNHDEKLSKEQEKLNRWQI